MSGATVAIETITDYGSREEAYYGGIADALALARADGWLTPEQADSIDARLVAAQDAAVAAGVEGLCPSCGHLRDLRPDDHGELVCADCGGGAEEDDDAADE